MELKETQIVFGERDEDGAGIQTFLSNPSPHDRIQLKRDLDRIFLALSAKVKEDTSDPETYLLLGQVLRMMGRTEQAIAIHRSILARPSLERKTEVQALTELGFDILKSKTHDFGGKFFEQALSKEKNHLPALAGMIRSLEKRGMFLEAEPFFEKFSKKSPEGKTSLSYLQTRIGEECLEAGEIGNAEKWTHRAKKNNPECFSAGLLTARIYAKNLKLDEAKKVLSVFILDHPTWSFLALRDLEDVHFQMNAFPQLEKTLEELIRKAPDNFYLHYSLARHLNKKKHFDHALMSFQKALQLRPWYVNSVRDYVEILTAENPKAPLPQILQKFFFTFKRSRRFLCPNCESRSVSVRWYCDSCGHWGPMKLRYELPAP